MSVLECLIGIVNVAGASKKTFGNSTDMEIESAIMQWFQYAKVRYDRDKSAYNRNHVYIIFRYRYIFHSISIHIL